MKNIYESPLNSCYSSREMKELFSPDKKFRTWRKLWIALAEAEYELGLGVTREQIEEMKLFADNINYDVAQQKEREVHHEVKAHIYAYGEQCPKARSVINLGASVCYAGDNTDIIIMHEALWLIRKRLINVINVLAAFAMRYKDMPTLGFTHLQPAQLTTVGKRACLWLQDLVMDLECVDAQLSKVKLLGSKGTTGTQASFMEMLGGDERKVKALDVKIASKMGYKDVFPVSGQTYPGKLDSQFLNVLSGIAQSAHKFSNDIRLLQHLKEIEEPLEKNQLISSVTACKKNPVRSERIAALARYVIINAVNPAITAAEQWLERTEDDSANKGISVPEAFLAIDAILCAYQNVAEGLVVYPKVIEQHIMCELPFMATENIVKEAVKRGGDLQELCEKIRAHSAAAVAVVKNEGADNDIIRRIVADEAFGLNMDDLSKILKPENYVGRAPQQTQEFIKEYINPIIEVNRKYIGDGEKVYV